MLRGTLLTRRPSDDDDWVGRLEEEAEGEERAVAWCGSV